MKTSSPGEARVVVPNLGRTLDVATVSRTVYGATERDGRAGSLAGAPLPMVASNAISDPGLPVNVKASREPVTSVAVTGQKDGAGASKHLYSTSERLMGLPVADRTTAWLAWPAAEARTLSIEPASEASNATCTGGPAAAPGTTVRNTTFCPGVAARLLTRGAPSAIVEAVSDRTDAARAVAGLAWRVVVMDVGFWLDPPHPHSSRQRSAPKVHSALPTARSIRPAQRGPDPSAANHSVAGRS